MAKGAKRIRARYTSATKRELPNITFDRATDIVISGKIAEGLRERTIIDYKKIVRYFTEWLTQKYEDMEYVNDVTIEHFRAYIHYLRYERRRYEGHTNIDATKQPVGLSETTVNIAIRTLTAYFNYLYAEGFIDPNPVERLKLIKQDVDMTNNFTNEEVARILEQPEQRDFVGFRDYVGISLLLDSGLRIGELVGLTVDEIDFSAPQIVLGGGRTKGRYFRIVPISTYCAKLLKQLIEENRAHFDTDSVFVSSLGDQLTTNHFNKRLKFYAERAGIKTKKVTAHVYRHTWAKIMIVDKKIDIYTVQKMGGWKDIRTLRRYVQLSTEDLRRSHDEGSPLMAIRDSRRKRI